MTTVQFSDEQVILLQDILDAIDLDDVLEEGYSDDYYDHTIDLIRDMVRKLQQYPRSGGTDVPLDEFVDCKQGHYSLQYAKIP